jgi:hypothetical protein
MLDRMVVCSMFRLAAAVASFAAATGLGVLDLDCDLEVDLLAELLIKDFLVIAIGISPRFDFFWKLLTPTHVASGVPNLLSSPNYPASYS